MTPHELFSNIAMFMNIKHFQLQLKDMSSGEWIVYYTEQEFVNAILKEPIAFLRFLNKDLELKIDVLTTKTKPSEALYAFEYSHPQMDELVDQLLDYLKVASNNYNT